MDLVVPGFEPRTSRLPDECSTIELHMIFAVSLNLLRSSNEQGCARRVHCIMCAVFSVARPHSQVVVLPSLSLFLATCESLSNCYEICMRERESVFIIYNYCV